MTECPQALTGVATALITTAAVPANEENEPGFHAVAQHPGLSKVFWERLTVLSAHE